MAGPTWLDGYKGQSTADLIALESTHRIDSIVLAFEQGIGQKPSAADLRTLTDVERAVLAIEALEREVNNGGYSQFFSNTNGEFNPFIVTALTQIGCPVTAQITQDAIARKDDDAALAGCDDRYYGMGESIADQLFAYIKAHAGDVRLP